MARSNDRKVINTEVPAEIIMELRNHVKLRRESMYSYLLGALQMRVASDGDPYLAERLRRHHINFGKGKEKRPPMRPLHPEFIQKFKNPTS